MDAVHFIKFMTYSLDVLMQDRVERMSKISDMKTAYAGY